LDVGTLLYVSGPAVPPRQLMSVARTPVMIQTIRVDVTSKPRAIIDALGAIARSLMATPVATPAPVR